MDVHYVLSEFEALGKERTKKLYLSNGANEPLYGVATGAMKPLAKQIKQDQVLADALYDTGNYDAMYFAGIIAEPNSMSEEDYERWISKAYFYMISDYIVAVTLAEADIGEDLANKWIYSDEELKQSAGWSCYAWMLGNRKDETFDQSRLTELLQYASRNIHTSFNRTKIAMNLFVSTVGISYKPLHEVAYDTAKEIGTVVIESKGKNKQMNSYEAIEKDIEKGRIGFKRKYVRC